MNREYKRDLNNNYMILNDEALIIIDDYRVRMLISNKIPFILKCNMRKFDGMVKYYYEITSKQPMNRTYEKKKIGMNELNNIVTSFLKVLDSSIEYLLNPNDFILNPEYIYMNIETSQIYFCYMPGYEVDISKNFNELTVYILDKIDHNDQQAVATAYELYRQTLSDNYSLRDILNSIKSETEVLPDEKADKLVDEEKMSSNNNYEEKQEERVKQHRNDIKPINLFGGIVIVTAVALLLYFITTNVQIIKRIKVDSDIVMKIAGGLLIITIIIIYTLIKKYQMKKEKKEEDSLIIITDRQEEISPINKVTHKKELPYNKEVPHKKEPLYNKEVPHKIEVLYKKEVPNKKEVQYKKEVYHKTEIQNIDGIYDTNNILDEKKESDFTLNNDHNANYEAETYGNTVLLACKRINRKLIASREKFTSFELEEKSFLVGKMSEHVDGIINDEMVSRIHAEIKNESGRYFLTDLNSTNGTFHNERRLEANETVEIQSEDFIRFATVEYVFR